jgi:hypothetical protein
MVLRMESMADTTESPCNQAVNRTPKAYRFWFPPLRSGAGYHQRYTSLILP